MKDKNGRVIHEPYDIKVLYTINFSKSMHYKGKVDIGQIGRMISEYVLQ